MYKVLIAEDEELIREGIKNIIPWEELGFYVVHCASDGGEALQLWDKESVDLVVTDISMPEKTGLDLLKEIRQQDKRVRFIILTGYDEFSYAKTAIQLDVEDYILKPINEEEMQESIKRSKEKLEKMDYKTSIFQYLKGKMELEEHNLEQWKLINWLNDPLILSIFSWEGKEEKGSELFHYVKEKYRHDPVRFYYEGDGEIVAIKRVFDEQEKEVEYFQTIQNQIENDCSISTFFAVSSIEHGIKSLKKLYETAEKLKKYRMIEGYGFTVDINYLNRKDNMVSIVDEEEIRKILVSREQEAMVRYLEKIFFHAAKESNSSLDGIYRVLVKTALIFQKTMEEFQIQNVKLDFVDFLETLHRLEDLYQLKQHFTTVAFSIMEELAPEKVSYTPVIQKIINEMKADPAQNVNLKSLSSKYHINASYLGQLFQKEVGCSFVNYVNRLRNEKAKELILNTDKKINEIAKIVGYAESNYFYRKFKQCYGVSPNTMREMKHYETASYDLHKNR